MTKPVASVPAAIHCITTLELFCLVDTGIKVIVCVGQGRSATAQQLSTSSPDTARHMSGVTEEVEEHSDKAQQSSTSSSAMREMHDSSSSWTRSSLAPRAKAAAKQQITAARTHTADAQISQINRLQPVCQQSAVHDAATDRHRSAVECIGQAATAAPHADVAENGMRFASALILNTACISPYTKWPMQLRLAVLQPLCAFNQQLYATSNTSGQASMDQ